MTVRTDSRHCQVSLGKGEHKRILSCELLCIPVNTALSTWNHFPHLCRTHFSSPLSMLLPPLWGFLLVKVTHSFFTIHLLRFLFYVLFSPLDSENLHLIILCIFINLDVQQRLIIKWIWEYEPPWDNPPIAKGKLVHWILHCPSVLSVSLIFFFFFSVLLCFWETN